MKKYFVIESLDEKTDLNGIIWQPDVTSQPRAILQVVHGMAEFIERYEALGQFFANQRILVVGHDHLGHGESVNPEEPLYGYIAEKNPNSILVEDTYQITNYVKKRFPDIPIFILGHSMGSFVVRNYLKLYSQQVDGAIIMGTGGKRDELFILKKIVKGLNTVSPKVKNQAINQLMFGQFNKRIHRPASKNAWLSKNEANVEAYDQHEKLGFTFTNNGFFTLVNLMDDATKNNWYRSIRTDLPILIISGEQDPVGQYGKGPRKVALELSEHFFTDVTLRLYHDLRHEVLNEEEQEEVMYDLYDWVTLHLNS
ncbi:alpha/beta fold hydrolase [Vagococcus silagei]|uniref:Alpha/beta fold hydrolase n=1 Tax=Vagococcus silagei TaxID=2508885 RepID=A0A4S3B7R3_9ENTE|nr:alpha/beta fold hydrolase [Vagococcus silagei]THB61983.1 alpha/beta fold hydrolase [Vagococcus silagei]